MNRLFAQNPIRTIVYFVFTKFHKYLNICKGMVQQTAEMAPKQQMEEEKARKENNGCGNPIIQVMRDLNTRS